MRSAVQEDQNNFQLLQRYSLFIINRHIPYIIPSYMRNIIKPMIKQISYKKGKVYVEELDRKSLVNLITNPERYLKSRGFEISNRIDQGTFSVTVNTQTNSSKGPSVPSEHKVMCQSFIVPLSKILDGERYSLIVGYKIFVSCK